MIVDENFKRLISFLYRYFVKSNLFMALCACWFYLSGKILFGVSQINPDRDIIIVIILSTVLVYHFSQKPLQVKKEKRKRTLPELTLYILMALVIGWLVIGLDERYFIFFGALGCLSFLYNSLTFTRVKFLPLRSIPLLKIFLISFVWASIGTVLPFLETSDYHYFQFVIIFLSQFFFIMAIALPYDIRDFYKDYKNNLKTMPGVLGISGTKKLAYVVLSIHFVGLLYINYSYALVYIPVAVVTYFLIKNSNLSKPNYYYIFFVDGLILLQYLSFYISEKFIFLK